VKDLAMRRMRILLIAAPIAAATVVAVIARWGGAATPPADVSQTTQVQDLRVTLQLDQPALGPRLLELAVQDAAGQPADIQAVRLRFSMAEMDMATLETDATPLGNGRFQARGSFFTMAGHWNVAAILRRDGQPSTEVGFAVPIAAPGEVAG
jgi:YtkA-like protein